MNTEELKTEFAKHLQVKELDTRDGYAVEWTVAAMSGNANEIDISTIKEEAHEHAKRVIALGWHENRIEEVIAGAWEAGYIFGCIDTDKAATQPDKSNEAGERKFTLDEMINCWKQCFIEAGCYGQVANDMSMKSYFKEKFNIDLRGKLSDNDKAKIK